MFKRNTLSDLDLITLLSSEQMEKFASYNVKSCCSHIGETQFNNNNTVKEEGQSKWTTKYSVIIKRDHAVLFNPLAH